MWTRITVGAPVAVGRSFEGTAPARARATGLTISPSTWMRIEPPSSRRRIALATPVTLPMSFASFEMSATGGAAGVA